MLHLRRFSHHRCFYFQPSHLPSRSASLKSHHRRVLKNEQKSLKMKKKNRLEIREEITERWEARVVRIFISGESWTESKTWRRGRWTKSEEEGRLPPLLRADASSSTEAFVLKWRRQQRFFLHDSDRSGNYEESSERKMMKNRGEHRGRRWYLKTWREKNRRLKRERESCRRWRT